MKHLILQILIAVDQLINAVLGGYADETLSARAWRTEQKGRWFGRIFRPLIDCILFFDPQHCYSAYLAEQQRRQFPPEYR